MPRAAKKKSEIDPAGTYVCWQSGAALVDGEEFSFHQGERLRGDSPLVQATSQFWTLDGDEIPTHWDTVVERNEADRPPPPDFELTLSGALPTPLAIEETIRLTRAVRVRGGYVDDQKIQTYERDTILPAACELASLLPDDAYEHTQAQFVKPKRGRR
jgi:hypothetical protein